MRKQGDKGLNSKKQSRGIWSIFVSGRPEVTLRAILMGVLMGALLACSNVYLAMKVGAFNGGSIPGAIIGASVLRLFGAENLLLETNIIHTTTSAGANFSGAYFDALPVAHSLGFASGYVEMFLYLAFGGFIGVSLTAIFRRYLVVEEQLPYPQGLAVANTLKVIDNPQAGKRKMQLLIVGFIAASVIVLLQSQLVGFLLPASIDLTSWLPNGCMFGIAISPLLIGFGYIMGMKSSVGYFLGNIITGLIVSPLLLRSGVVETVTWESSATKIVSPASGLLIGGTVLTMLLNYKSFLTSFRALTNAKISASTNEDMRDRDIPLWFPLGVIGAGTILLAILFNKYAFFITFPLVVVLAFLFSLVAARTTGETGLCPTSLFVWVTMAIVGTVITKNPGVIAFISGIVAVSVGQASDSMNDMKTGHLIGAVPGSQQIVQYMGMLGGALAAPLAFKVIVDAYGIFNEQFPVPFGMVAKEIVSSVSQGANPFDIRTLIIGLVAGGAMAFFGLPALPVGLGLFAPLSNGAAVLIGGLIRFVLEKKSGEKEDDGVAFFSGVLGGEGLMGIIIAALVAFLL